MYGNFMKICNKFYSIGIPTGDQHLKMQKLRQQMNDHPDAVKINTILSKGIRTHYGRRR